MATQITPLPPPPSRADPANFAARGDAFLGALPVFQTETNAVAAEAENNRDTAILKASEALSSQQAALISETNANNWAVKLNQLVLGTDYSAKEWAIGVTVPAGSAKDWAVTLGANVDGSEFSAKEYAIGVTTPEGSAKEWAVTLGANVDGSEFSAKEYAIGTTNTDGSAKDWARKTGALVAQFDYSSKEWAIGDTVEEGSAKFWAGISVGAGNFTGVYNPATTYSLGQTVSDKGAIYASLVDSNTGNPTSDKNFWVQVSTRFEQGKFLFFGSF